ncbi:MAG: hypothetical protein QM677_02135 [Microbacterium sp.]
MKVITVEAGVGSTRAVIAPQRLGNKAVISGRMRVNEPVDEPSGRADAGHRDLRAADGTGIIRGNIDGSPVNLGGGLRVEW